MNDFRPLTKTDRAVLVILAVLIFIFAVLCVMAVDIRWDITW